MSSSGKISLFLLRLGLGWLYLYAGLSKLLDPQWSAEGYLKSAKTLPGLFGWFASPAILPFTNLINEWGLTLLGVSLILGIFVKWSAPLGMIMMLLYYLPILQFPHPDVNSYIVDQHIIFIFVLFVLAANNAGRYFGLDGLFRK